ncbi:pilus assembly FimT family protein [Pseudoduganella lutea]|uniref:Type II secretion system protein n=1 Tax=Pseudoduganella lutea TaxID=321985 RepID=A0A4V0Z4E5_9BURK|nr:type II secretion system protein [Pseudoduganella lutea]QBE66663.1 type II secretion system protein [Pseudoduganella lutea]
MNARAQGFTLVELVTVMILIGVLAAVAVPRLIGSGGVASTGFRADVVSALRYAQKTAVSHRRTVCATVSASAVTLRIASTNPPAAGNPTLTCDTDLPSPDGTPYASRNANVTAGDCWARCISSRTAPSSTPAAPLPAPSPSPARRQCGSTA